MDALTSVYVQASRYIKAFLSRNGPSRAGIEFRAVAARYRDNDISPDATASRSHVAISPNFLAVFSDRYCHAVVSNKCAVRAPRQRFAQLVSNDAAKRWRGPLECTYILNLRYTRLPCIPSPPLSTFASARFFAFPRV